MKALAVVLALSMLNSLATSAFVRNDMNYVSGDAARKQKADQEIDRETQERLRRGRNALSKTPGFLLDALTMRVHPWDVPKGEAAAREWLKVYPKASPEDKFHYASTAVWLAESISDAQARAVNNPTATAKAQDEHYPLSDLGRKIVAQALDAQTHGQAATDGFVETLLKLEKNEEGDTNLREKISRVLQLPQEATERSLQDHVKELQTQVDIFGAEKYANNEKITVSTADRDNAHARLEVLIPLISKEYRESSTFDQRAEAPKILNETFRLFYLKLKAAEPLFWQVEESVPITWADNALCSAMATFGYFCQQKDFTNEKRILLKLIAMEQFCEENKFSLAEDWYWLGETYESLGEPKKAREAYKSALPLYFEMKRKFEARSVQTDGLKDRIDYLNKKLKRS